MCDGVKIHFIRGPGYARNISLARIRHNRHFARTWRERAAVAPRPDLIVAPIPIIEAAFEAVSFGIHHGIPVLTDIRDLWPDELRDRAPKALRPLAQILLARSYAKMKFVCRGATGIMGVSKRYRQYGLDFAGRELEPQDFLFPLGYSGKPVAAGELKSGLAWCREFGLSKESFVVAFFGTIGEYFDLETVIKAARILQNEMNLQVVLAGDGSKLDYYKKMALGLKCVYFPGWLDAPKIAAVMHLAKVGLAPYRLDANMTLPNKPFEYMAGALPIVSSVQSELPELLLEARCGITYQANSVDQLVSALRELHANESERRAMGERARKLFESRFSNEVIFAEVARHFTEVVRHHT